MSERKRWKDWADGLRQEMMESLTPQVTKSVEEITSGTTTVKPETTLRSERFWRSCQVGTNPNDVLSKAGFEIEFEPDKNGKVREVTLRLDANWMSILQRVLDRNRS